MAYYRWLVLTFAAALLLGACGVVPTVPPPSGGTPAPSPAGGGATPTPLPPQQGTLIGIVLLGPMCPVVRADQPCPDQPYAAEIVVQYQTGKEVARLQAGADGRFAVTLAPGEYTLVPQQPEGARLPRPQGPLDVSLLAGQTVAVTITYDSGIR